MAKHPCIFILDGKTYTYDTFREHLLDGGLEKLLPEYKFPKGAKGRTIKTSPEETKIPQTNAEAIYSNEGQIPEGRNVQTVSTGEGGENLQRTTPEAPRNEVEQVTKTYSERAKTIADNIRKLKVEKDGDVLMSTVVPLGREIWNGAVETTALAIEAGGKVADAVDSGLTYLKDTDWYKKLSDEQKQNAENRFREKFKDLEEIAEEKEPGKREKGFLQTIKKGKETTADFKKKVEKEEQFYETLSNKESIKNADKEIGKNFEEAKIKVLSTDTPPSAEKSVMAMRIIKHYESIGDYDTAVDIMNAYDLQLREAGRAIQAISLWSEMSPRTIINAAKKVGKKLGGKYKELITPEIEKNISKRFGEIQKMTDPAERAEATAELMNYIAEQFPLTKREWLDAYRYTNMLSNPRSHERNIYSNALNTFLVEPMRLGTAATYQLFRHPFNALARDTKFSDVPQYLKSATMALPDAVIGFKEAMKNANVSDKFMETQKMSDTIEAARQAKMPKYLTFVPRLLEAQDRFFSTLIANGEKSRLMKNGLDEAAATERGSKLGEKYLYREKLGTSTNETNAISRALDSLGETVQKIKSNKHLGNVFGWFVPFIRTPINIAKLSVEFSPLGFLGGKYKTEQVSSAALGTMVTAVGAILAANNRTTWAAPQDKKERELFYASGRKPYAVQIGDKWVPMTYFGTLGLALALPAAFKHYYTDTQTSLTDSYVEKSGKAIMNVSSYIMNQTPLAGVESFFKALDGESDIKFPQSLGFMSTQFIPLSGLVKNINQYADPVYRKPSNKTFWDSYSQSILKDIPFASENVPAIESPEGEPVKREPTITMLPYDIGITKPEYEEMLKIRREALQKRKKELKEESDIEEETGKKPKKKKHNSSPDSFGGGFSSGFGGGF